MKPRSLIALSIRSTRPQTGIDIWPRRSFHTNHLRLSFAPLTRTPYRSSGSYPTQDTAHSHYDRYASSSAAARVQKARRPPPPSIKSSRPPPSVPSRITKPPPIVSYNEKLNPPSDTYRADLSVPERKPNQNYFAYLYHCGRAYGTFYKTGIKRVYAMTKLAKTYRQKQKLSGESSLTRAEWQVIRRSRGDMLRLLPFGALVVVFGEWLPLFVMWLTPVVPEACRIPKQTQRVLSKLEARRRERERRLAIDAARLIQQDRRPGSRIGETSHSLQRPFTTLIPDAIDKIDMFSLLTVSAKLDSHSWVWDKLFLTPPRAVLKWQIRRRLEYLRKDDERIDRDGGWQGLGKQEVERACIERGYDILGKSESEMRRSLAGWFGGGKI